MNVCLSGSDSKSPFFFPGCFCSSGAGEEMTAPVPASSHAAFEVGTQVCNMIPPGLHHHPHNQMYQYESPVREEQAIPYGSCPSLPEESGFFFSPGVVAGEFRASSNRGEIMTTMSCSNMIPESNPPNDSNRSLDPNYAPLIQVIVFPFLSSSSSSSSSSCSRQLFRFSFLPFLLL